MVKNWSKIVLVSMIVVVFASSLAYASTTRVRSLGHMGDYISDDSNVYRWYSTLPSYANMVQAELGDRDDSDSQALSLNYSCGDEGKYGTWRISLLEGAVDHPGLWSENPFIQMHTPTNGLWSFPSGGSDYNGAVDTPINKFDVAWGYDVNEDLAVGVAFTYSSWMYETTFDYTTEIGGDDYFRDDEMTSDNSFMTIGAGATWSNGEDMTADVQFTIGMASFEGEGTMITGRETVDTTTTSFALEDDNSMALDVAARFFYDWKEGVTVVPVVEYSQSEYVVAVAEGSDAFPRTSVEIDAYGTGLKTTHLQVGVGLDIDVNQDNTLLFAVEYSQINYEYADMFLTFDTGMMDFEGEAVEGELKIKNMPTFRLALETAINSWLTTRIGATKSLQKTTDEWTSVYTEDPFSGEDSEESGTEEYTSGAFNGEWFMGDDFGWYLGVGFDVAEWTIDMELTDDTPFSMGYWLTGYSEWGEGGNGPVARISGTYNF